MGIYGILRTLSLHTVIKTFKKDFKFIDTVKNLLITQFFNGVTPFASGGQPAQIYFLKTQGVDLPTATSIVIQNFAVYQIVLIIYGLFAIIVNYFLDFFPNISLLKGFIILGFTINSLVMLSLLFISYAKKTDKYIVEKFINFLYKIKLVKHRLRTINKVNLKLDKFHESAISIRKNRKAFFKCFLYNFFAFIFLYSLPFIIILSTGNFNLISFITSFVACAFVMIIGAFVPIPGGSGGLEFAFSKFYGEYLGGPILATSLLIWRFITYYLGMIIGAIAMSLNKRR